MKKNIITLLLSIILISCQPSFERKTSNSQKNIDIEEKKYEYLCTGTYGDVYRVSSNGSVYLDIKKPIKQKRKKWKK